MIVDGLREAGVSAHVVDGLRPERLKPVIDAAIARFQMVTKMSLVPLRPGYLSLIIADALGLARAAGLELRPAPSWSALRDMLAPVPVAAALGLGASQARFDALQLLNANGNVIGVSATLAERMTAAGDGFDFADARCAGAALLAALRKELRIGVPFPFSMHSELVQYRLKNLGLPLPAEPEIRTVPPPLMADALAAGKIDAFAVGEPWGSQAVARGVGALLLPGAAIWTFAPEKVLATRAGWAEERPDLAGPMMRAIWRANRFMVSDLLAAPRLIEFFEGAASFPWRSQAAWIGARLALRNRPEPQAALQTAAQVFRPDLYRRHLHSAGAGLPEASSKCEGALTQATAARATSGRLVLCPDSFIDRHVFDPAAPITAIPR